MTNHFISTHLQMWYNNQINYSIEIFGCWQGREIGEPSFVIVAHMHAAIKHDIPTTDSDYNTTSSDVYASASTKQQK